MAKKSIAKNYIYNLLYQILILILPLITTPYLSRVLGAENVGIYSYTLSIATYFVLFGSLGVAMYGQREIAYLQDKKEERSKTFFEILIMRFITLGISLAIFYFTFAVNGEYSTYYKILVLEIIANSIDISWFFQGLEEFKKTVTRNLIIKIISVTSIFLFIKTDKDLIIYFIIYVLSNLFGNLSLWFYLPKYIVKVKFKIKDIFKHIKPLILLFVPQVAMQVYTVLDKTMIGSILKDMTEVGNYEQSQKIIKISLTIITSLGTVVAPRIASTIANKKEEEVKKYLSNSFDFVWFLGIPIMFGIMAISYNFVPWFLGDGFEKSKLLLIVGAPLIMAIGLNNVSGIQYLIPSKNQNIFTKSVIIGAIFNFITNFTLIPIFKSVGAIIASVLAETLILIVQLIYVRKEISVKMVFGNCFKYIVSGIIMLVITASLGRFLHVGIVSTIIQIVVGATVYFSVLLILKDKFIFTVIDRLRKKLLGANNEK